MKTYDSNGRLKTVYATATSRVTRSPGEASFMYNTASVEKNGVVVKSGKTSSCAKPPHCTLTYSSISWLCKARPGLSPRSYVFCDGYYRAEAHYIIVLTSKWVWTEPAPKGCEIASHDHHRMTCTEYSPSIYVPETD